VTQNTRTQSTTIGLRDEGIASPRTTLDWSTSTSKRLRIVEPCAIAFEDPYAGDLYVLELEHDHDGGASVEWRTPIVWATTSHQPPSLSGPGLRDILTFYHDGTDYIGAEFARGIPAARAMTTGPRR